MTGVQTCALPIFPEIAGGKDWWWQLSLIITCGTAAGAIIPELVKVFTSTNSKHVREVVTASEQGGASLNILSGFVAGNFSAYWLGAAIVGDPVYSRPDDAEKVGMTLPDSGMLLHAWRLVVPRPPKDPIDVTAPIPDRFGRWLDFL